jgi:hypothetical protein
VISFKNSREVIRTPDTELWRLRKDRRALVCSERTTPLGPEIRLLLDGDLLRSELCRPPEDAQDLAREWRIESEKKGWA